LADATFTAAVAATASFRNGDVSRRHCYKQERGGKRTRGLKFFSPGPENADKLASLPPQLIGGWHEWAENTKGVWTGLNRSKRRAN
jgi:hypothetical protein